MFSSILVICTGNVCRSPLGERLLRQRLPGMRIDSAGTHSLVGKPADIRAQKVAAANGLSLDGHVARTLTRQMFNHYDLILAMAPEHIRHITRMAPEVRGKTLLFGRWLGSQEVPDPFQFSHHAFEHVYSLLGEASLEWSKRLSK